MDRLDSHLVPSVDVSPRHVQAVLLLHERKNRYFTFFAFYLIFLAFLIRLQQRGYFDKICLAKDHLLMELYVMNIATASFDFRLRALEPLILPSYKGSTLRGGFGHAFRRIVCAIGNKVCPECILRERCVYAYVFETSPPRGTKIMRKYTSAPHPFVIEPPTDRRRGYKPEDLLTFRLTLIGKAVDYLPYFIYAFDELGKIGIGKGKAKYELRDVTCDGTVIYDSTSRTLGSFASEPLSIDFPLYVLNESSAVALTQPEQISISFLTPTRILFNGHLTLDLEFHVFVRNLLRRLALLSYFHCDGDPAGMDFKGAIEKAKEVHVKVRNLRWFDWERYSGRQDTRMKLGGFVGTITFEGLIGPFLPIIQAGEILHVGKGTAFGLGKYGVVNESSGR